MKAILFTLPRLSLLLLLFYLRLHVANSIECYQCTDPGSEHQGYCLNHTNRGQTVVCDDKFRPSCYSSSFMYPDEDRSVGVELGCISAWSFDITLFNMTKPECRTFNKKDDNITDGRICFCNTHKCNVIKPLESSSSRTKPYLLLVIFIITKLFSILD